MAWEVLGCGARVGDWRELLCRGLSFKPVFVWSRVRAVCRFFGRVDKKRWPQLLGIDDAGQRLLDSQPWPGEVYLRVLVFSPVFLLSVIGVLGFLLLLSVSFSVLEFLVNQHSCLSAFQI